MLLYPFSFPSSSFSSPSPSLFPYLGCLGGLPKVPKNGRKLVQATQGPVPLIRPAKSALSSVNYSLA